MTYALYTLIYQKLFDTEKERKIDNDFSFTKYRQGEGIDKEIKSIFEFKTNKRQRKVAPKNEVMR